MLFTAPPENKWPGPEGGKEGGIGIGRCGDLGVVFLSLILGRFLFGDLSVFGFLWLCWGGWGGFRNGSFSFSRASMCCSGIPFRGKGISAGLS